MPIVTKIDGKRYRVTYHNGEELGAEQVFTLKEKLAAIREIFSTKEVVWAPRREWIRNYSWENPPGHYEPMEKCPESVWCLDLRKSPEADYRPFVELRRIGAGEDSANQVSTVDRSNYRRLKADYPGVFTDVSYNNVNVLGAYVGNLTPHVLDLLARLADQYPLYNDDDHSQLEHEEIEESYSQWVKWDIGSFLDPEALDMWEALDGVRIERKTCNEDGAEVTEEIDAQEDIFWDAYLSNSGNDYASHSGIEVIWDYKAMAGALSDHLSKYFASDPAPSGQLPLFPEGEVTP